MGRAETTPEFRVSLLLCDVGGAQSGWSDAIDPNAKSTPFPRGRSRQPTKRFLGAVIITEQGLAIDTLQRTEIDDPSVRLRLHVRNCGMNTPGWNREACSIRIFQQWRCL